ncbi:MAG: phospholipase D family protein, partial [Cytophagales bacterium]|nr:phospholipase D family protein [Cytophagales bacterium]
MAEFLDTQGVSYYLKRLINNASDKLYLISPYLQLNNQLKLSLEDRHKFKIDIIIIYGKVSDLNPDDSKWLDSMPGIKLMFHKDLHAKCYINEKEAIITSMNLYMFSQQNNVEMGIYVHKEKDEALYNQIASEVDRIKRGSEHRTITVQKVEPLPPADKTPVNRPVLNKAPLKQDTQSAPAKASGFCIRTGVKIPFNPARPLSYEAFQKWNQFGDQEYPEKFCHFSGEPSNGETSVRKPILRKNWQKAKEVHG